MIEGALLALLLAARPAAGATDAEGKWTAPEAERARVNPVEAQPAALLKGRALYQKHCASCHGDEGKGDGPAARYSTEPVGDLSLRTRQERLTDGEVFWKISKGRREGSEVIMPALANKVPSEEDRWKVVLFVRSLATPK